jgi:hypothetical protein
MWQSPFDFTETMIAALPTAARHMPDVRGVAVRLTRDAIQLDDAGGPYPVSRLRDVAAELGVLRERWQDEPSLVVVADADVSLSTVLALAEAARHEGFTRIDAAAFHRDAGIVAVPLLEGAPSPYAYRYELCVDADDTWRTTSTIAGSFLSTRGAAAHWEELASAPMPDDAGSTRITVVGATSYRRLLDAIARIDGDRPASTAPYEVAAIATAASAPSCRSWFDRIEAARVSSSAVAEAFLACEPLAPRRRNACRAEACTRARSHVEAHRAIVELDEHDEWVAGVCKPWVDVYAQ